MLESNSTNGNGEGGRLAVAQAAALSRGEEEKRYRIYIWQFISTYVLCTYIRISIYHNKLDLTNLMP